MKWSFIRDQVINNCIAASIQRAGVYRSDATDQAKAQFRESFRTALREIGERYGSCVEDPAHLENIGILAQRLSGSHADILRDSHVKIGVAQKALNLYLKYLWCLGCIPTPPHCPFDRRIIDRLGSSVNWTQMDDETTYLCVVNAAKEQAVQEGKASLAEWELDTYQQMIGKQQQQ